MLRDAPRSPRPASPMPCLLLLSPSLRLLQDAVNSGSWHVRSVLFHSDLLTLEFHSRIVTSKPVRVHAHSLTLNSRTLSLSLSLTPFVSLPLVNIVRNMQNEAIAGAEFPGAGQAATTSAPPQDTSAEIYSGGYSLCSVFYFFLYQHYKEYITIITINIY